MQSFGADEGDINVICELLAVKHGDLELDLFSNLVLDVFIDFCVLINFFTCAYFLCVYSCTIFIIK